MSKAVIVAFVAFAAIGVGLLFVRGRVQDALSRPAVERLEVQRRLQRYAEAIAAYRARQGTWPTALAQIHREGGLPLTFHAMPGVGSYAYRPPPATFAAGRAATASAPASSASFSAPIILWAAKLHADVRAGEPWGGADERATADVPAVGYVLNAQLEIEALGESAWRARLTADGLRSDAP